MLNRRSWLKQLGIVSGMGLVVPRLMRAELQCGPQMPPYGIQACVAGIPEERLNMVFAYQQASEWCWAACIQMVFGYYGHPISQQEIVRQTWGVVTNMPAQPQQLIGDLNRTWQDADGDAFTSRADAFTASGATAAQDLAGDMPLIIASMGHAMILSAVSYNRGIDGSGQVSGMLVRDPWPGRGGKRPLTPQEAAATMMLIRIRVS